MRQTLPVLCLLLTVLPASMSFADDDLTQTLHYNPFQESASVVCTYFDCSLDFAATAHTTTLISAISCAFNIPGGGQVLEASLSSAKGSATFHVPSFFNATAGTGVEYWGINAPVNLFVSVRDTPRFYLSTFGSQPKNLSCTISGYHS